MSQKTGFGPANYSEYTKEGKERPVCLPNIAAGYGYMYRQHAGEHLFIIWQENGRGLLHEPTSELLNRAK